MDIGTSQVIWFPCSSHFIISMFKGSLQPQQCAGACEVRCSATSHKKPCLLYCNQCCNKCLCVPSGTFGHKEECPCYNNWKTKEGGPKCP
ncbi:hypothetical protein MKW94_030637 [Papaver nudicaule]|uniref:Uncharacterized protein n=1 Tax=Papaver nudicaule TaxID=74823 RepID=A0AA41S8W0_PAPNU|nr:hypothetical protein [Papaver nudicaule]